MQFTAAGEALSINYSLANEFPSDQLLLEIPPVGSRLRGSNPFVDYYEGSTLTGS
jgi:hypothetical protein